VEALGAFFFFATAWYIVEDKARVDRVVAEGVARANDLAAAVDADDSEVERNIEIQQRVEGQPAAYVNHAMED